MGALEVDGDETRTERPSGIRLLLSWLGIAAVLTIAVGVVLAWRSVDVQRAAPEAALARFTAARGRLDAEPILRFAADGTRTRRLAPAIVPVKRLSRLRVLAYRAPEQRLVRADVPFWFLKVKEPAVRSALEYAGLDLTQMDLAPAELERYGPCIVLDETRPNGDRLLIWTE